MTETADPQNDEFALLLDQAEARAALGLAELRDVRTSCARCGASYEGGLEDGREWFRAHLLEAHGQTVDSARQRRPGFRLRATSPNR